MRDEPPSSSRLVAGGFAAAAAAPFPFVLLLNGGSEAGIGLVLVIMFFGTPVAALHVLLAMPIYLVLRRRWRLTWWNAAIGGFAVGALPTSLLTMTWDGFAWSGSSGALGGVVFWTVLRSERTPDLPELEGIFN